MNPKHPPPPRGVDACMDALVKRRDWVAARDGGSYDRREHIALSYALGFLESAKRLGLVGRIEVEALSMGWIDERWIEPQTREENDGDDEAADEGLPPG